MALQKYPTSQLPRRRKNLWFERTMAIVAVANLGLVVFDLTYVSWRNFWLQGNILIPFTTATIHVPLPQMTCRDRSVPRDQPAQYVQESVITCLYDPVKGIEYHRDTRDYLNTVNQLEQQIQQQGIENGLKSPEVQALLATLRQQSNDMIVTNPFAGVNKSGTLEQIKNRMRRQVRQRVKANLTSRESFNIFWSTDNAQYPNYLSPTTWNSEISWFNTTIRPLIETNYYRTIGEDGQPTNYFWVLDAPFVILFLLEFLARTFYISRRYTSLTWLDAAVWRWYDIPLFIPFSLFWPALALTRVIPTVVRLHQAGIIDLNAIAVRVRQGFVAAIAEEISEVVVIQVVNQIQASIRAGEFSSFLQKTTSRRYVDINNVNEIEAISQHVIQILTYQVFPKVQPDLEALLRQAINSVLGQSPAYRGLQSLPGIGTVPAQLTERLVTDLTQLVYNSFKAILEDPKTTQLTTQLVQNVSSTFLTEAQRQQNLQEIQILLADLLEEIKINYVQRLSAEDTRQLLDQTRQLQQLTKKQ